MRKKPLSKKGGLWGSECPVCEWPLPTGVETFPHSLDVFKKISAHSQRSSWLLSSSLSLRICQNIITHYWPYEQAMMDLLYTSHAHMHTHTHTHTRPRAVSDAKKISIKKAELKSVLPLYFNVWLATRGQCNNLTYSRIPLRNNRTLSIIWIHVFFPHLMTLMIICLLALYWSPPTHEGNI